MLLFKVTPFFISHCKLFLRTELNEDNYAKRDDLKSILIIGSGPIIIGQACEFDYSGSQSLRSLREDGIETILIEIQIPQRS